ncbi:MAG: M28 family peptidase [Thermoanaerobaculia bacterium]|nr:M28 family peptidase [Thermoanaerobaculia bacterium]
MTLRAGLSIRPLILLSLIVLVAFSVLAAETHENSVISEDVVPSISAATIQAHLDFLADDLLAGRDTGSDQYQIAANYIASHFRQFGLQPSGDDGTFFQRVDYRSTKLDPESVSFVLAPLGIEGHEGRKAKKKTRSLTWKEDFLLSPDLSLEQTRIEAGLVFVGFGIDAPELGFDNFVGNDLQGKILVEFTGAPTDLPGDERAHYSSRQTKRLTAARHGAVGILWIPSRSEESRRPWERRIKRSHYESLGWSSPEGELDPLATSLRINGYLNQEAARTLFTEGQFDLDALLELAEEESPTLPTIELSFTATVAFDSAHSSVSSPNVVGLIPGSDPVLRDEYVLYSAHLDHVGIGREVDGDTIYNGAYDNAMGSAITLAVAEAMMKLPKAPRRSTLFLLVGGEEKGLLGSGYFANYPAVPIDKIVADVNIDMPLMLAPLDQVIAFGAEHSTLAEPIAIAAAATGFTLVPDPKPEQVLFVRSDQYSFVRKGVPSVYLVPGPHSTDADIDGDVLVDDFVEHHYHRPSDDLGRPVDWPTAERFAETNLRIGIAIANAEARPTWIEGDFFGKTFGQ